MPTARIKRPAKRAVAHRKPPERIDTSVNQQVRLRGTSYVNATRLLSHRRLNGEKPPALMDYVSDLTDAAVHPELRARGLEILK